VSATDGEPTELNGVQASGGPSGDRSGEVGAGDLLQLQGDSTAVSLIQVQAGDAEVDHGWRCEGGGEGHGHVEGARLVWTWIIHFLMQRPTCGQLTDTDDGGEHFPGDRIREHRLSVVSRERADVWGLFLSAFDILQEEVERAA
jgi:hypothetical protein